MDKKPFTSVSKIDIVRNFGELIDQKNITVREWANNAPTPPKCSCV